MPKVSVIIPVYGVEKYIERCARSLFEQTLDDMEFIFVDDCTTDDSITILQKVIKEFPRRQSQIKILHHSQNMGLPQARRTGVLSASGDFIAHCDSDDWVDVSMYNMMYKQAVNEKSDMIICDYIVTDGHEGGYSKTIQGCSTVDKGILLDNMLQMLDPWPLWNKLFKKQLFQRNFIYPEASMAEDMVMTLQLVLNSSKISYNHNAFYYYYANTESITKKKKTTSEPNVNIFLQRRKNTDLLINVIKESNNPYLNRKLIIQKWFVKKMLWSLTYIPKYRKLWLETYSEINYVLLFSKYIPFKEKLQYIATLLHLYPFNNNRILE